MFDNQLFDLVFGTSSEASCVRLDLVNNLFEVFNLVDPVVVHGVAVSFHFTVLIPITKGKG